MYELYIINNGKFSQSLYPWESLDLSEVKKNLANLNISAKEISFADINNSGLDFYKNKIILFGGSQNKIEKSLIEDYAYWLTKHNANVIPSYECLRALENKGFQALSSESLLGNKKLKYFYNDSDKIFYSDDYVYKLIDGAGSNGVFRCENKNELTKKIKNLKFKNINLNTLIPYIKQVIKKLIKWRYIPKKEEYYKPKINLVMQRFIRNLNCDYKVLIFGKRYFVLKRNIASGDFRASGSNLFEIIETVPNEVLDMAKNIFTKLNTPYCSLDISIDADNVANLIEYQCTHFGPYTYLTAIKQYFINNNGDWVSVDWERKSLEWAYAEAIAEYLNEKLL
ncbi:hypothetical protein [Proteus penneri]|uniref:ATP-grasp domain-containing protein n=1 Tax=Proteus penneri TaxID=102862 RepID=A0A385JNP7_9GAMM|nr:hypothetical protein [Proteus penneri]AXY99941.1 hypothetical protein [Proteus penneri]